MWRSEARAPRGPSIAAVQYTVLAVGRVRPPFVDDVQHYQRLLARHARVTLIEVREDEQVERRIPDRSYVSLLDAGGSEYGSEAFARWLEERRPGGRDVCFVVCATYGTELERCTPRLSLAAMTLPPQLPRVALLKQLSRAHKILANEPYHH